MGFKSWIKLIMCEIYGTLHSLNGVSGLWMSDQKLKKVWTVGKVQKGWRIQDIELEKWEIV